MANPRVAMILAHMWISLLIFVGVSAWYGWMVLRLPCYVLDNPEYLNYTHFNQRYPRWKWFMLIQTWGGLIIILALGGCSFLIVQNTTRLVSSQTPAIGFVVWFTLIQLFQGILELTTQIHARYGFIYKHHDKQQFVYHDRVTRLGAVRCALSFLVFMITWSIAQA